MKNPQKKGAIVLAVAGVLALGLGIWQLNYNIKSPFKLKAINKNALTGENTFDLQTKDTDGDGLTDFEEINLYNTSPYLADTDSDAIPDGEEVKNDTDPNCPSGKTCGTAENAGAGAATVGSDLPNSPLGNGGASVAAPVVSDLTKLTPADIRKMLKDSGMKDADLNKLDDKTLMQIYAEALKQQ
ncbi:MAG: hypothetical protein V1661_03545 [bacterium]